MRSFSQSVVSSSCGTPAYRRAGSDSGLAQRLSGWDLPLWFPTQRRERRCLPGFLPSHKPLQADTGPAGLQGYSLSLNRLSCSKLSMAVHTSTQKLKVGRSGAPSQPGLHDTLPQTNIKPGMVVYTFNYSSWETETGRSLCPRPAWSM